MIKGKVLVTGAAGFIGFHVTRRLLDNGIEVLGLDNLNDYYDPKLKEARLDIINRYDNFSFEKIDLSDRAKMPDVFNKYRFSLVIHLAAQAGVRYSLENPHAYMDSNITGFLNVLEGCRHTKVKHLIYASSSSVYGGNTKLPFAESDRVDNPVSLYAATKKSNELMAHAYFHLFEIPNTGLRFFTVYGPWGRPDMALFIFTKNILAGEEIDVYGEGEMWRDFTYIDEIVDGVIKVAEGDPKGYIVYNIGNNRPEKLTDFIRTIEDALGKKARIKFLPMQPGDVRKTYANIEDIEHDFGFRPVTSLKDGINKFVEWYREYHNCLT